jgi:hypothetical protein
MSAAEVAWRMRSTLRDTIDRWRMPRLRQHAMPSALSQESPSWRPGFATSSIPVGAWRRPAAADTQAWATALTQQANAILSGHLSFFALESCNLGRPINWNCDHESKRSAPRSFSAAIDYRDFGAVGDAKLVWEPNRHHQLVVLGRAYRATGDLRYAAAVLEQLESWLAQCPFGEGMNWRSPLELALRLINWVWALDLIRPSGLPDAALAARLIQSAHLHLWEITRKYSRGSSANNHLIGEAAGVFIAASYFADLPSAQRWAAEARQILTTEILSQTRPDGGSREQALGYQSFVMQLFTLAGWVARQTGSDFPAVYWDRLEKMFDFVAALLEGAEMPAMFGDSDDGYVLDLSRRNGDLRAWLPVAAVLFRRADLRAVVPEFSQCAYWLLGPESCTRFEALPAPVPDRRLTSRAFPDSGYYLLQSGRAGQSDRISVCFDCGPLGWGALAAHGHADALSFTLQAFGVDVLVDPGTFDYFAYPDWRTYFRSTRAHNTIEIDGVDQSVMAGPFMWSARAQAACVDWQPSDCGGQVVGDHDGYVRLPDPVVHRRKLELDGVRRVLTIEDHLLADRRHSVAVYFHFAEGWKVRQVGPHSVEARAAVGRVRLELDRCLAVNLLSGSEDPKGGWVSRGYHRKVRATTVTGCCTCNGSTVLTSHIEMSETHVK